MRQETTGHYPRKVPEGYEETLKTGKNQIAAPHLAQCYELHRVLTQEPNLFMYERLKLIVKKAFNTSDFDVCYRAESL